MSKANFIKSASWLDNAVNATNAWSSRISERINPNVQRGESGYTYGGGNRPPVVMPAPAAAPSQPSGGRLPTPPLSNPTIDDFVPASPQGAPGQSPYPTKGPQNLMPAQNLPSWPIARNGPKMIPVAPNANGTTNAVAHYAPNDMPSRLAEVTSKVGQRPSAPAPAPVVPTLPQDDIRNIRPGENEAAQRMFPAPNQQQPASTPGVPPGGPFAPPRAVPVTSPRPADVAAAAPSASGPTPEQIEMFRRGTASNFDPNSWLDRNKMNQLLQGNKDWASNQAARSAGRGVEYDWAKKSSFIKFAGLIPIANKGSQALNRLMRPAGAAFGKGKGFGSFAGRAPDMRTAKGRVIDAEIIPSLPKINSSNRIALPAPASAPATEAATAAGSKSQNELLRQMRIYAKRNPGKTSLGVGGAAWGTGRLTGYDAGDQDGMERGLAQGGMIGYDTAMSQAQNTPFMSRLMGKYNFDPSQAGSALRQFGKSDAAYDNRQTGLINRLWGIPFAGR
jgi:hypothetical protein